MSFHQLKLECSLEIWITRWNRFLLQGLILDNRFEKFLPSYWTWKFIFVPPTAHHWTLSRTSWIQYTTSHQISSWSHCPSIYTKVYQVSFSVWVSGWHFAYTSQLSMCATCPVHPIFITLIVLRCAPKIIFERESFTKGNKFEEETKIMREREVRCNFSERRVVSKYITEVKLRRALETLWQVPESN
jgi:hypothetical protein